MSSFINLNDLIMTVVRSLPAAAAFAPLGSLNLVWGDSREMLIATKSVSECIWQWECVTESRSNALNVNVNVAEVCVRIWVCKCVLVCICECVCVSLEVLVYFIICALG